MVVFARGTFPLSKGKFKEHDRHRSIGSQTTDKGFEPCLINFRTVDCFVNHSLLKNQLIHAKRIKSAQRNPKVEGKTGQKRSSISGRCE